MLESPGKYKYAAKVEQRYPGTAIKKSIELQVI
jgi:hypothetical protein